MDSANGQAPAERLLLLDDDPGILRLQRRALERAGYEVTATETGDQARECLRRETFALLVLDYRLGDGSSGLEVYEQLRAEHLDPPAILVTAFSDERRLMEAFRAGVRDVVPKSGEYLDYLPHAVRRVLAQVATERQLVEAQALRRSEERLRALNAELARSEQQQRAQAEQLAEVNRAKDEFLAMLAHELRNPLAPIRFAVSLLEGLSGEQAHAREIIERQVSHLVRLVDDLLDVSRITHNTIKVQREPVRLRDVVRTAVESTSPLVLAERQQLVVAPVPDVWLDADAARLSQALTNLLNNAAKFTPPEGRIEVTADLNRDRVAVTVRDAGIGIDPVELPHVFDVFYQAEKGLHRPGGGLGLGLTLVKRIAELHDGTVEARSEGRGQGAAFTMTLPLRPDRGEGQQAAQAATSVASRALRVLVVDDNHDSTDLLATVVRAFGHDASKAFDGVGGLAEFERYRPDVAILDIGLPGQNGYELAKELRRRHGKGAFLIALTGWGQEEDRRLAQEAGFDCHLVKPVDPDVIAKVLQCIAGGAPCDICERCVERNVGDRR